MMRFLVCLMIISIGLWTSPIIGQADVKPSVSAHHAVLMDSETGEVLFGKEPYQPTEIASITKIMTALVAIKYGDLDDEVKISRKAAYTTGSSIYLEMNETMKLEDLLYGLMLRSGNDAAVAIAEHVGGSEEGFVYLMNETAAYIGMSDTHFMNAHGLDDSKHYASAYDMALLMREAMNNEQFRKMTGAKSFQSEKRVYPWMNKNKLLTQLYNPCTGGKTGYTRSAGRTLVTTAEKDHLTYIAVTLDAPDDWNDHIQLYEEFFEDSKKNKEVAAWSIRNHNPAQTYKTAFVMAIQRVLVLGTDTDG